VWFIRPIDDNGDMRFLDNVSAGVKVGCDLRINEDIWWKVSERDDWAATAIAGLLAKLD
jgi:hypothetical protein